MNKSTYYDTCPIDDPDCEGRGICRHTDEVVAVRLSKGTIGVRADLRYNSGREEDVSPSYLLEQYGAIVYKKIEANFNRWVDI